MGVLEWTLAIAGGGCGLVVLLVLAFIVYAVVQGGRDDARMAREGRRVVGWIVFANEKLYQVNEGGGHSYAQVVFNLEPDTPATREELQRLAEELPEAEYARDAGDDERIIGQVMDTHIPYTTPLRVPDRLTDGREVYTASVLVYWYKLPGRRLTRPYLYCDVIVEGKRVIRQAENQGDEDSND